MSDTRIFRRLAVIFALLACISLLNAQDPAETWRSSGQYFGWQSSPANGAKTLQIFYVCIGEPDKPALLMLHGFSDKPTAPYLYTLKDDAELTRYFLKNIAKFNDFVLYSHDRGDSVALNFLQLANPADPFKVTQLFLTNGNMYLPLANLTEFQKRTLNPATSAVTIEALQSRPAKAAFWLVPCGSHYAQHDQPQPIAQIIRLTLAGKTPAPPANLSGDTCAPVLVGEK
jgi:pimeloyl-ACP methyl ester carboxylesterase